MGDDSSVRTPTPEFSYMTTKSNLTTPAYTSDNDDTIPERPESTSNKANSSSALPLDVGVPGYADAHTLDDATTIPDDSTAPTQLDPSDLRSDIFADISEEQSKSKATIYPPMDDAYNMGMNLDPDFDLNLDMVIDYAYDAGGQDATSSDSNSLLAKKTESFDFVIEVDQEEEKVESEVSEETTPSVLDRIPYFNKFMDSMVEYGAVKRLNNVLHKKMTDYFRKRKMDHVLVEVAHPEEAYIKYGKKLDNFAVLRDLDAVQRRKLTGELTILREVKKRQCSLAAERFQALLDREIETGVGLINSKTGKEISTKLIHRLITAQATKANELRKLRLLHITIRNAMADKSAAIKALDKIGDNYTLMEFEQLKVEHQSNMDKMEDRDDELIRMRKQCRHAVQSLAHVREKCSSTEENIRVLREALVEKQNEKTIVREQMNSLKQQRDFYRLETQRLKEENGLLTKDRLLIDMENAIQAINDLENVNQMKRDKLELNRKRLSNLRAHYEQELQKKIYMSRMLPSEMPPQEQQILAAISEREVTKPKKPAGRSRLSKFIGDRPSEIRPRIGCAITCKPSGSM